MMKFDKKQDLMLRDFKNKKLMKNIFVPIIMLHNRPDEYPNHIVARLYDEHKPTPYIKLVKNLIEFKKKYIPADMNYFKRTDDEKIIGSYL